MTLSGKYSQAAQGYGGRRGGVCRSDSQETKWLHRQLKCNISPLEKLTFVGEFKTGDVALGVLLSPALRPEQEHPAQRPHAAPERAHGPGVEFGDVLQIDASRVDVLSLVWCRRGEKKTILVEGKAPGVPQVSIRSLWSSPGSISADINKH